MVRTNSRGGGCVGCEGLGLVTRDTQQGSGNQLRSTHPTDSAIITLELKSERKDICFHTCPSAPLLRSKLQFSNPGKYFLGLGSVSHIRRKGLDFWKENTNLAQANKPDTGSIMTLKLALEPAWLKIKGHGCHRFIHTHREEERSLPRKLYWLISMQRKLLNMC